MVDPRQCVDLVSYRIRLGLTLRQLGQQTGLSPATLHRIENAKTRLSARSKYRLQEGLGLTAEDVVRLVSKTEVLSTQTGYAGNVSPF